MKILSIRIVFLVVLAIFLTGNADAAMRERVKKPSSYQNNPPLFNYIDFKVIDLYIGKVITRPDPREPPVNLGVSISNGTDDSIYCKFGYNGVANENTKASVELRIDGNVVYKEEPVRLEALNYGSMNHGLGYHINFKVAPGRHNVTCSISPLNYSEDPGTPGNTEDNNKSNNTKSLNFNVH